jgi:hypothetical protein
MHKKHRENVQVRKNAFVDSGDGVIAFPEGQVISDASVQRNGTRYDITTMDVSEYEGQVTADHFDTVDSIVGQALNWAKNGDQLTIGGIRFAVNESALARLHYDLMRGGFPVDLSIETYGPYPDQEGVYYNSKLIGLSTCVVGNNKSATINKKERELVLNSLAKAKEDGLDTSEAEKLFKVEESVELPPPAAPVLNEEQEVKFKTIKQSRDFPVKLTYKNASGEEVTREVAPGDQFDVSEDQEEALNAAIATATNAAGEKASFLSDVKAVVEAAVAPIQTELNELKAREEQAFNNAAAEPEFKKTGNKAGGSAASNHIPDWKKELQAMDYEEVHVLQINDIWSMLKNHDMDAAQRLQRVNTFNLERLKEAKIVKNSVSISDMGNFVISPELISEIQGIRTDYTPLVSATTWKETLSTQMAWLTRNGDINMQPVEYLDNDATSQFPNGNLKPLSTYSTTIQTGNLEELAAVTPVMNSATRFLAVDLLGDVATGYRTDYDRKRAQLIIARLQQAVNATGNKIAYNVPNDVSGLVDFLRVWSKIGEKTPYGTFIIGTSTFSELQIRALSAGTNGPLANIFTNGQNGIPLIFNKPYILVSDDLLPALNTGQTKSFAVDGSAVTIDQSVFYTNLSNFTGRTSGGLNYDMSLEAAYEEAGVVKSSFQRNELLLRGSFFRGGQVLDQAQVASLGAAGIS